MNSRGCWIPTSYRSRCIGTIQQSMAMPHLYSGTWVGGTCEQYMHENRSVYGDFTVFRQLLCPCELSINHLSLIPRPCRRNGLATSASSNCYFCCQRVDRTNHFSECCNMTTVNQIASCVEMYVAVTPIHRNSRSIERAVVCSLQDDFVFVRLLLTFRSRPCRKQLLSRAGKGCSQRYHVQFTA